MLGGEGSEGVGLGGGLLGLFIYLSGAGSHPGLVGQAVRQAHGV